METEQNLKGTILKLLVVPEGFQQKENLVAGQDVRFVNILLAVMTQHMSVIIGSGLCSRVMVTGSIKLSVLVGLTLGWLRHQKPSIFSWPNYDFVSILT
jgi:hypothetical protein